MKVRELVKEINNLPIGNKLRCIKLIKDFCNESKNGVYIGLYEAKQIIDEFYISNKKCGKNIVNALINKGYIKNHKLL